MSIADKITRLQTAKTNIASAITTKGGTVASGDGFEDFASDIATIPSGGTEHIEKKDVNFYDYDGTILCSWTAEELQSKASLPSNPTHTGLVAQGWNWSLNDIKQYVSSYGFLDVGQMYDTNDGSTKFVINVKQELVGKEIGVQFCILGTISIDWGDGSSPTSVSGTSVTSSAKLSFHQYQLSGRYTITVSSTGSATIGLSASTTRTLICGNYGNINMNFPYMAILEEAYIGSNCVCVLNYSFAQGINLKYITISNNIGSNFGNSVFNVCGSLKHITIPATSSNVTIGNQFLQNCYVLETVSLPKTIIEMGNQVFTADYCLERIATPDAITIIDTKIFQNCYKLTQVALPNSVTTIGQNAFQNCYSLTSIVIPPSVTVLEQYVLNAARGPLSLAIPSTIITINANALSNMFGLQELRFISAIPPTVSNGNAFSGIQSTCIIYVPSGSLSAYTSATNYPDPDVYTYVEVS